MLKAYCSVHVQFPGKEIWRPTHRCWNHSIKRSFCCCSQYYLRQQNNFLCLLSSKSWCHLFFKSLRAFLSSFAMSLRGGNRLYVRSRQWRFGCSPNLLSEELNVNSTIGFQPSRINRKFAIPRIVNFAPPTLYHPPSVDKSSTTKKATHSDPLFHLLVLCSITP